MEDIFKLDSIHEMEQPKIEALQYAKDSKVVFDKMMKAYTGNHYSRKITEHEFALAPCYKCSGCESFEFNGKTVECFADKIEGECYENCFDYEAFYSEIVTDIMFGNESNYLQLVTSEIK